MPHYFDLLLKSMCYYLIFYYQNVNKKLTITILIKLSQSQKGRYCIFLSKVVPRLYIAT